MGGRSREPLNNAGNAAFEAHSDPPGVNVSKARAGTRFKFNARKSKQIDQRSSTSY